MKLPVRSKDFWSGLFFIMFGLGSLALSSGYESGSAARMGPGFFPSVLGWLIAFLGIVIAARAFWRQGEEVDIPLLRPLFFVIVGVVCFGLLVDKAGLVLATLALVVLARAGGRDFFRIREIFLQYVVLTAAVAALFVFALQLPIQLWPL